MNEEGNERDEREMEEGDAEGRADEGRDEIGDEGEWKGSHLSSMGFGDVLRLGTVVSPAC